METILKIIIIIFFFTQSSGVPKDSKGKKGKGRGDGSKRTGDIGQSFNPKDKYHHKNKSETTSNNVLLEQHHRQQPPALVVQAVEEKEKEEEEEKEKKVKEEEEEDKVLVDQSATVDAVSSVSSDNITQPNPDDIVPTSITPNPSITTSCDPAIIDTLPDHNATPNPDHYTSVTNHTDQLSTIATNPPPITAEPNPPTAHNEVSMCYFVLILFSKFTGTRRGGRGGVR